MTKMKTKGIIAAIILLIVAGYILQTTGLLGSLESKVTPQPCSKAEYADNCICALDEERLEYSQSWAGVTTARYYCEKLEKAIDIDVAGWEAEAELLIEQKMQELHPDCDMATCDNPGAYWQIWGGPSIPSPGMGLIERVVYAECISKESEQIRFARAGFTVESGDVYIFGTSCTNYYEREEGVGVIYTSFVGGLPWYSGGVAGLGSYSGIPYTIGYPDSIVVSYGWSKSCPVVGEAFSEVIEYKTPYGMKILEAKGTESNFDNVRIEILETDEDTIRFRLRGDCGSNGGSTALKLHLKLDFSENCMSNIFGIMENSNYGCKLRHTTTGEDYSYYEVYQCNNGVVNLIEDEASLCNAAIGEWEVSPYKGMIPCCTEKTMAMTGSFYCSDSEFHYPDECISYGTHIVADKEWCATEFITDDWRPTKRYPADAPAGITCYDIVNQRLDAGLPTVKTFSLVDIDACTTESHAIDETWHFYR